MSHGFGVGTGTEFGTFGDFERKRAIFGCSSEKRMEHWLNNTKKVDTLFEHQPIAITHKLTLNGWNLV